MAKKEVEAPPEAPPTTVVRSAFTAGAPTAPAAAALSIQRGEAPSAVKPTQPPSRISAFDAAKRSDKFPGGASAFVSWLAAQGEDAANLRPAPDWEPLLEAFAQRSIPGHRRRIGGTHTANDTDIRR